MTHRKPKKQAGVVLQAPKPNALLSDVRDLILQAREGVARAVDSGLTTLYWHVGRRVRQDILKQKRAEYGGQIVSALERQLELEFGRGFSEKSLRHMIRFSEAFPDFKIVSALLRRLSWTHFVSLIYLDDQMQRDLNALQKMELIAREPRQVRARREIILSFLPFRRRLPKKEGE